MNGFLARKLARAAHRIAFFAHGLLGGLFVEAAPLHLTENALALHFFLQNAESLLDIVVANENLQLAFLSGDASAADGEARA